MNRMIKKLLAAVLVTSMLLGSNGISFAAMAAETDSITSTEEAAQEAGAGELREEPEAAENSGAGLEESTEEVEQVPEEDEEVPENAAEESPDESSEAEDVSGQNQVAEEVSSQDSAAGDAFGQESAAGAVEDAEEAGAEADSQENAEEATADGTPGQEGEEQAGAEADPLAAEEQAQEQVFTAGALVFHGTDYDVTLTYDENAKIPAAAELKVREIEKGTSEYESYLRGAEAAAGKGVAEARFFDITIWAAGTDGKQQEIQPQSQVRVNITYHKAIEVASEGEVQAMHFENGTADAEVVGTDTNGGSEVSEIAFDAASFSVYGIVYTVDFTYDGFTYCIEGGSSIYLSELAQILGLYETDLDKAFSVGNVSNVTFTNYDLVNVEKQADGDWLLTSLAPFTSEETLTITMKDGVTFIIDVTDDVAESSELVNFVKNVIITGASQNADGSYNVEKSKEYKIIIAYEENTVYQFDNDATLTYSMPQGITVLNEQSGPMTINIMSGGRTYQVGASYHLDTDGNLQINFDQNDPYYSKLVSSTNVSFRFEYYAEFDGSSHNIRFSEEVERDIVFEEEKPGQAFVSKTATYDEDTGRFNYTIKVTADGDVQNVNVKDIISGNALRFNLRSAQK